MDDAGKRILLMGFGRGVLFIEAFSDRELLRESLRAVRGAEGDGLIRRLERTLPGQATHELKP